MKNLEIKARVRDRDALLLRVEACGARHQWTRRMRDTFFRVPVGWLKLREAEGAPAELIAYERPATAAGPRASDYELAPAPDPRALERALTRVLPRDVVVAKERALFLHGATRIHVDRVDGLGDFVELETVVTTQSPDEAQRECAALMSALGIEKGDLVGVPYRDLLA
jgi:adenylate cyclase class IV